MNTIEWWKEHWLRNPNIEINHAELLPKGWELWVRWNDFLFSGEHVNEHNTEKEKNIIFEDGGRHIGFIRMVASKKEF